MDITFSQFRAKLSGSIKCLGTGHVYMYMLTFDLAFIDWSAVLFDNFIFSWKTILDGVTVFRGHLCNACSGLTANLYETTLIYSRSTSNWSKCMLTKYTYVNLSESVLYLNECLFKVLWVDIQSISFILEWDDMESIKLGGGGTNFT